MNAESKVSLPTETETVPQSRRALRRILMGVIPAVVLTVGAAVYLLGGRYVGTDNAYVKADIASVSPEVSGNIHQVLVAENQLVKKGEPILVIDDTNYRIALVGAEAQLRNVVAGIESDKARYRRSPSCKATLLSLSVSSNANRPWPRATLLPPLSWMKRSTPCSPHARTSRC